MAKQPVIRLEQALRSWEDFCFLLSLHSSLMLKLKVKLQYKLAGALVNWKKFRDYLLSIRPMQVLQDLDPRFEISEKNIGNELAFSHSICIELARWTANSRRVYHVPADLSTVLTLTSLGQVTWEQVTWPFRTFVLSLEQPLISLVGTGFDCVMVSVVDDPEMPGFTSLQILLLSNKLAQTPFLTEENREGMLRKLKKPNQWLALEDEFQQLLKWHDNNMLFSRLIYKGIDPKSTVQSTIDYFNKHPPSNIQIFGVQQVKFLELGFWEPVLQVVVGLCLYLTTLPNSLQGQKPELVSVDKDMVTKVISERAEVCYVYNKIVFSQHTRMILDRLRNRPTKDICPHFVQGHWRRPPGKGNDPTHPKTVHVMPYHVGGDKLGEGELTVGSETVPR